jgi:hypothetical protein
MAKAIELIGDESIELNSELALPLARRLRVVRLDVLEERLSTETALEVITTLATSDELLCTVSSLDVRCGLVSYRQVGSTRVGAPRRRATEMLREMSVQVSRRLSPSRKSQRGHSRQANAGSQPVLTLDAAALRGIIDAARALQVDALWLDAWCFRCGDTYNHEKFCDELFDVTEGVVGVVWLPRARQGAHGDYQYRLWCTFEAACVLQRSLPVGVAGAGLSADQRWLRIFGSFAPALFADAAIAGLCRLNLCFFVAEFFTALSFVVQLAVGYSLGNTKDLFLFSTMASVFFFHPLLWSISRGSVAQQVRLAKLLSTTAVLSLSLFPCL